MNFEFPDVAVFPENEAPVRPPCDAPDFASPEDWSRDLAELKRGILDFLGAPGSKILDKQLSRFEHAAVCWLACGGPALDGDGIRAEKRDTARLRDFFAADIRKARRLIPKDDVKSIDRAVMRNDDAACKLVGDFLGYPPVKSVVVHVSQPGDRHHYQQFRDCKTVTKLLNLHVDPKPGIVKAIIYLDEVTEEDGPFQLIKGSNKWPVDTIQRLFAWGNSVGNYLHTPEHRRVANAFPSRFRRNAIVGRLIPDGTEMSDFLLDGLTTYTSDVANVMVFDPCFNFHRGGQCRSGTRINLQVVIQ